MDLAGPLHCLFQVYSRRQSPEKQGAFWPGNRQGLGRRGTAATAEGHRVVEVGPIITIHAEEERRVGPQLGVVLPLNLLHRGTLLPVLRASGLACQSGVPATHVQRNHSRATMQQARPTTPGQSCKQRAPENNKKNTKEDERDRERAHVRDRTFKACHALGELHDVELRPDIPDADADLLLDLIRGHRRFKESARGACATCARHGKRGGQPEGAGLPLGGR